MKWMAHLGQRLTPSQQVVQGHVWQPVQALDVLQSHLQKVFFASPNINVVLDKCMDLKPFGQIIVQTLPPNK